VGPVPPLHRYCETLRLPAALPAGLRFPSACGDRRAPKLRSARGVGAHRGSREDLTRPLPGGRSLRRRRQGLPGSWGTPLCTCPAPRPRWAGTARLTTAAPVLPSDVRTTSAPRFRLSGLTHAARTLAVYASPRGLPQRDARLASGCSTSLAGRGWLPAGSLYEVSDQVMVILLVQAWPGAPGRPADLSGYPDSRTRRPHTGLSARADIGLPGRHTPGGTLKTDVSTRPDRLLGTAIQRGRWTGRRPCISSRRPAAGSESI